MWILPAFEFLVAVEGCRGLGEGFHSSDSHTQQNDPALWALRADPPQQPVRLQISIEVVRNSQGTSIMRLGR